MYERLIGSGLGINRILDNITFRLKLFPSSIVDEIKKVLAANR